MNWTLADKLRPRAGAPLPWSSENLQHVDPYLVWAEITAESPAAVKELKRKTVPDGLGQAVDLITVVVELKLNKNNKAIVPDSLLAMQPTYQRRGLPKWKRVQSCVLPRDLLLALLQAVSANQIVRFELSKARGRDAFDWEKATIKQVRQEERGRPKAFGLPEMPGPLRSLLGRLGLDKALNLDQRLKPPKPGNGGKGGLGLLQKAPGGPGQAAATPAARQRKADTAPPGGPLLGIIDDLCPFASPKLRRADGSPAVRFLWDQGIDRAKLQQLKERGADRTELFAEAEDPEAGEPAEPGVPEAEPPPNPSDAIEPTVVLELALDSLDSLDSRDSRDSQRRGPAHFGPAELVEPAIYRRTGYLETVRRWGHGTAVTSAAAGDGDTAPEMVWVQLPDATVNDTSGGSLAAHALDGMRYVLDRAGGRQVVLNLSYGTHSGPHDGTSMFETGMQELLDDARYQNLHIVLPAGNSHLLRTHSSFWLRAGCPQTLRWRVLPDDTTDSYVELWFPAHSGVTVSLAPPAGAGESVTAGQAKVLQETQGAETTVHAAMVFPARVPQGLRGTMCLLALAPTRRTLGSENSLYATKRVPLQAPHGVWTIEVTTTAAEPMHVHAWIQRDDTAPGRGPASRGQRGRQSYFLDGADDATDPRFTLNGIATLPPHPRLRVVGAYRADDGGVSLYSSAGPDRGVGARCTGPDVCAVGDHSLNLPGLLLGGTMGASRLRVAGTSIAAAVVAGMWQRHLAACKSAESFCFFPLQSSSRQAPRAQGEPERADDSYRGALVRIPLCESNVPGLIDGFVPEPVPRCVNPLPAPAPLPPPSPAPSR